MSRMPKLPVAVLVLLPPQTPSQNQPAELALNDEWPVITIVPVPPLAPTVKRLCGGSDRAP